MSLGISSVVVSPEPSFTGGEQGPSGVNGLSAYQIAVVNGFVGTEQQWLASIGGAGPLTISSISGLQTALDGKQNSGNYATLVGGVVPNTLLSAASTLQGGTMSASDKIKLDGVESQANKYIHPTTDGNLHVPATGTSNNGKILKAGATAGSFSWDTLSYNDLTDLPTLGTAAATAASDYATAAQGAKADLAVQKTASDTYPVNAIRCMTQGNYDALTPPDSNTLYVII